MLGSVVATPESVPEVPSLQAEFDRIVSRGQAARASWSALAVSLDHGDTLFLRRPDARLAPASNIKLFTTAAALRVLGPSFRFRTFVLATAPPSDGVVEGDLILYGTGDPGLSDRFVRGEGPLERLADRVQAQGVHLIRGDLIADGSFLNGQARSPEWPVDDLDDWYAAPVRGLSFNENLVTLRLRVAGEVGDVQGQRRPEADHRRQ